MATISLCMIVKNEEAVLERCLHSISGIADEIILVDTGSTDRTREIALKFAADVYHFSWIDDFAAARNFSFTQATMDYILWLDADDYLLPEDNGKLALLKQSLDPALDAVSMLYHCDFDDQGNVNLVVRRSRLVRRARHYQWKGVVHEDLAIHEALMLDADIIVTHGKSFIQSDPGRNIRIYEKLISTGEPFQLRDLLHYAMELHQHKNYQRAAEYYLLAMEHKETSEEDQIFICGKLVDCYYYLGDRKKERAFIFQTLEYDAPRPELCCRLGYYFLEKGRYHQAIFWYKAATEAPEHVNPWTILNKVSRTWLPHMQLGLCYYNMGKYEEAYHHNQQALAYRPDDPTIKANLELVAELLLQKQSVEHLGAYNIQRGTL
jgi:glycosyltransferase involved in cell wall biosynthesis